MSSLNNLFVLILLIKFCFKLLIPILFLAEIYIASFNFSLFFIKSILLTTVIIFPLIFFSIFLKLFNSFKIFDLASITCRTIFDFFAFSNAISIPIFSILFSVFLIPAVSMNLNCIPSILILSSIASLVVPSIS